VGRQLWVGAQIQINFCEFVSQVNDSHIFYGYCIDVFNAALTILPYAVSCKFIPFGDEHLNLIFIDLLYKITMGVSMNYNTSINVI
jgi:ionotropic glutamate receptor